MITPLVIQSAVSEEFQISRQALMSRSRLEFLSWPRQIAMVLTRQMIGLSLDKVGELFSRDHRTVFCAEQRVRARCETEPSTRQRIERLRERILKLEVIA